MLDQGQTITVSTVARVYNLVQFDGMKTERIHTLEGGGTSSLRVDHTRPNDALSNNRHLAQLVTEVNGTEPGQSGAITINVTFSHPKWVTAAAVQAEYAGLGAWVTANAARILTLES